jgi:uncharacterized protein
MQLALGGKSSTEFIGPDAGGELIVRTDGSYELVDALKLTAPDIVGTGMYVETHDIESVAKLLRQTGHLGKKTVATACQACPVLNTCGGGHVATRYSMLRQFDNPSAYCADLMLLTNEISRTVEYYTGEAMARALHARGILRSRSASMCGCFMC